MTRPLRCLSVTVVHRPDDSRVRTRLVGALLDAGWEVVQAAPFGAFDLPLDGGPDGLTTLDLPRARGRRRGAAWRAVRALLRERAGEFDVVLAHDPEILTAAVGLGIDHLVWDVEEDTAATFVVKEYLPTPVRGLAASAWRAFERVAERRWSLQLADHAYAARFHREHPVVTNTVVVPTSVKPVGDDRVVYLGTVTTARGCTEMVRLAEILREATAGDERPVRLDVIGHAADAASEEMLTRAREQGLLTWRGYVPSEEALPLLDGALCGISLLHDLPNYRPSMPTKVVEYLARGVPAVTTPLPVAVALVEASGGGLVVPFEDPQAAADAILALRADPERAASMGAAGHAHVAEHYDWATQGPAFAASLAQVAAERSPLR